MLMNPTKKVCGFQFWITVMIGYKLSRANGCIEYLSEYHNPPEWGIKGDEDADMISHIICYVSAAIHGEI